MASIHGIGIGLRKPHFDELPGCTRALDWLEFVPENFVGVGGRHAAVLERCRERWPLLGHGVSANVGAPDPLDRVYLGRLKALLDRFEIPWYSDHLCYSALGGVAFYDLLPLPLSDEAVVHTAARVRQLADILERPIVLENISAYARMPGGHLSEGEFVTAVLEEADARLLLDVNNVFVNATNHGTDAFEDLAALPLDRTAYIHVAGHVREGSRLLDHHGAAVCEDVWQLYAAAIAQLGPTPTLVEWDTDIPSLDRVIDEADHARVELRIALEAT